MNSTTIKLFSKNRCPQCKFTKRRLDELNLKYEVINVEENQDALDYIKGLGILSVPVTEVGDLRILGYRPDELNKLAAV